MLQRDPCRIMHYCTICTKTLPTSNRTFCPMIPSLLVWQVTCQAQMAKNNSQTRTKGAQAQSINHGRWVMDPMSHTLSTINQCPVQHPTWLHRPTIFQNYGQVIQRRANIVFCLRQVLTVLFTLSLSLFLGECNLHACMNAKSRVEPGAGTRGFNMFCNFCATKVRPIEAAEVWHP